MFAPGPTKKQRRYVTIHCKRYYNSFLNHRAPPAPCPVPSAREMALAVAGRTRKVRSDAIRLQWACKGYLPWCWRPTPTGLAPRGAVSVVSGLSTMLTVLTDCAFPCCRTAILLARGDTSYPRIHKCVAIAECQQRALDSPGVRLRACDTSTITSIGAVGA